MVAVVHNVVWSQVTTQVHLASCHMYMMPFDLRKLYCLHLKITVCIVEHLLV